MAVFDGDEHNINHIAEHGISPEEVEQVIDNAPFELIRYARNGEQRQNYLGETDAGLVLAVVTTDRAGLVRVVTAHQANRSMRQRYGRLKEAHDAEDFGDPKLQE